MFHAAPIIVSVSRTVPRHVRCEHCGAEYVYELTRTGIGQAGHGFEKDEATIHKWAVEAAFADLTKELDTGAEAVPCPACYKYQQHMTAAARKLEWGWVRGMGGWLLGALPVITVLAVLVAVVAFPGKPQLGFVVAGVTAGLLLLAGALAAVIFYLTPCKPNQWSEAYRKAQAESLACARADFMLVARAGGPFAEDLTAGREAEYAGVLFLWVLAEEIADETTVPFVLPSGREVEVELDRDDHDGVFLHEDRLLYDEDDDGEAEKECRICLRVFSVYRPKAVPVEAEPS
jgi:hypothetical protein